VPTWTASAGFYYRQGKLDDARGLLERALIRTEDPTVHDHLGDVYLKLGKTKEASCSGQDSLREFAKALQPEADPDENGQRQPQAG